jgi:hypothetical protein
MTETNNSIMLKKFSVFEHVAPTTKLFSWKIAILNTMVFCLTTGIDTYGSRLPWANDNSPQCHWGYRVWLCAIPLVLGNYWLSRSSRWRFLQTWLSRTLSPYLFTILVCWCVSWLNFRLRSHSLHLWQMLMFPLALLPSFVSSVIRYYTPHAQKQTEFTDVNPEARIAWVEGISYMWRMLAITSVVAIFAFLAFCLKANYDWAMALPEPQRSTINALMTLMASGITLYIFLGPIYECFLREEDTRNMLLEIKKEEAKDI